MDKQEQTHICRVCGRKLRSEDSKQRGMGYTCYQKWLKERNKRKLFKISSLQSRKDSV